VTQEVNAEQPIEEQESFNATNSDDQEESVDISTNKLNQESIDISNNGQDEEIIVEPTFAVPLIEDVTILGTARFAMDNLPEHMRTWSKISNLKSTEVYLLRRPNFETVFPCPKKYAHPSQKEKWDMELQRISDAAKQEEQLKQEIYEKKTQEKVREFKVNHAHLIDEQEKEEEEVREVVSPKPKSIVHVINTKTSTNHVPAPLVDTIYNDDSMEEDEADFEISLDYSQLDESMRQFFANPDTQQVTVPKFETTDAHIQYLTTQLQLLSYELHTLHDTIMPSIRMILNTFIDHQVDLDKFSYVKVPLGLNRDQFRAFYKTLFGRKKHDSFYWAVFGTKGKTDDSTVRAGKSNPSIAYSCYEQLEAMQVPPDFKLAQLSHPYFYIFFQWFVEYHWPYCEDVYHTTNPQMLQSNGELIKLIFKIFQNRCHNKSCSAKNSSITLVQKKLQEFKASHKIQAKGATKKVQAAVCILPSGTVSKVVTPNSSSVKHTKQQTLTQQLGQPSKSRNSIKTSTNSMGISKGKDDKNGTSKPKSSK
jgi:hypothetical protein